MISLFNSMEFAGVLLLIGFMSYCIYKINK